MSEQRFRVYAAYTVGLENEIHPRLYALDPSALADAEAVEAMVRATFTRLAEVPEP